MDTDFKKTSAGHAHSKLILVGEHAVVYEKPAIAIPFPLRVKSTVQESSGNIFFDSHIYSGPIEDMPLKMKGISDCIKEILLYLKKTSDSLRIEIQSFIPLGRGLGSSAAIATAIVRSLFSFYGQKLSQEELFYFVQIAETHAHGKASGIDMAAVSSDGPIWFQKGKAPLTLKYAQPLYIVVADTGRIGDTRTAVENVRKRYDLEPERVKNSLYEIEKIAYETKDALLSGNMQSLGQLLDRNHAELTTLGVSDEGLNSLVKRSKDAGALGAKLTGGGLGGCILALAESLEQAREIAVELKDTNASSCWYFSTEGDIFYEANEGFSKSKY